MKRITFLFFMSLLSFCGYAQLAPECFEGSWAPVTATPTANATDWLKLNNGIGLSKQWVQQDHSDPTPSYEGTVGTHAAFIDEEQVPGSNTDPAEDLLVTPEFEMPVGGELRFQSRLTKAGNQGNIYRVYILVDDGDVDPSDLLNYTMIQEWTEPELALSPILIYEEKLLTFGTTYDGQTVRLAFAMLGDDGDRWLIDCVSVTEPCLDVAGLTSANIGMTSAELNWTTPGGATSWEIEIVLEDGVPTGHGVIYNGALPYVATQTASGDPLVQTPLLTDTCYKYYVRAICDDGGSSDWVGASFFCTVGLGDTCNAPMVITTLPYSDSDNTANFADEYNGFPGSACGNQGWEDYLSGNDVVYSFTPDFTGTVDIEMTNNGSNSGMFVYNECSDIGVNCIGGGTGGNLGNDVFESDFPVTAGEDYFIVISTYSNPTTDYTLTIQQVFCEEPVNLPNTEIGMTGVTLNWTNPSGATSWEIVIQDPGDGIPAGAGTTVPTAPTLAATAETDGTAFTAATPYEYYVRADCGDGTFSAWGGPFAFNTMICEGACEYVFIMTDLVLGWEGNTMNVSQNGIVLEVLGPQIGSGNGPTEVIVPVCSDLPLELYWNSGGSFANEVGIAIENNFGQIIYSKPPGSGSANSLLYSEVIDCDVPQCLAPTGLDVTNIGMTTVDLSWDGPATGNWEYYIVEEGDPAPTDATSGTPTTSNPTIGAGGVGVLEPATNYEYYVRMICEDASTDESPWSEAFEFSTASCEVVDQCAYEFVMHSNWWDGWQGGTMTISQNGATVAVIGPEFDGGQTMTTIVNLCDDVPFEVEWTSGGAWQGQMGLQIINSYDQLLFDMPFNSVGVGTVIFEADNDCDFPACIPPTGLYTQNGDMDSIEIGWDGDTTGNWEYYIVEAGSPAPDDATPGIPTDENPTTAALANPATNYEFYVRLVCEGAASDHSIWAGPYAFHSEVCNDEDKCTFTFEMLSQNGWGGEQNSFTIYQAGVPVAQFPSEDNIWWWGFSYTEEIELCHNEEIEVVWNSGIGWTPADKGLVIYTPFLEDIYTMEFGEEEQGNTVFTGVVSCDPPPCPKPQNLNVTDLELTEVTLEWDEMGTATEWSVWVLPLGTEEPLPDTAPTFTTSDNPVVFGDDEGETLLPGTPYEFYVMAMCGGDDGNSTVSGPFVFVTAIVNDECEGAIEAPVNASIECDEVATGTLTGSTYSGMMPSCQWGSPVADVWYQFEATSETHGISVLNVTGDAFPYFNVFEGDCDGGLTEVYCGFNSEDVITGLTPGNTYFVMVYATWINDPAAVTSFDLCIRTPENPLYVSETDYTVPELIQDVFIGSECAIIENIEWKTGEAVGRNGIGYFNQNGSSFPFSAGIVLVSGDAETDVPGPNDPNTFGGGWDNNDLEAELEEISGLGTGTTHGSSSIKFDFSPLQDIDANLPLFKFMFASNEYGTPSFECTFSDIFAFILTDLETGESVNLALLPSGEAILVTTIHYENDFCEAANPELFGQYNDLLSPINLNGQTIPMDAMTPYVLEANHQYRMHMILANQGDDGWSSAVFLLEGSMNLGAISIGADLTIDEGTALCSTESTTIESGLDPELHTFVWLKDGEVIEGEDGENLLVEEPGVYTLEALVEGTECVRKGEVTIEFYDDIEEITNMPSDLSICDNSGFAEFNLAENTAIILDNPDINPAEYVVTYHATEEDALNDENALPELYTNTVEGEQPIWVRIENTTSECYGFQEPFFIRVSDFEGEVTSSGDLTLCEGNGGTISVEVAGATQPLTYAWTKDGEPIAGTEAELEVTETGEYEVTVSQSGCTVTEAMTVTVVPVPVVEEFADVEDCDGFVLPVLAAGNYFTGQGGTGTMIAEGSMIDSTQEIFIYAETGTTPNCSDESSFMVTIFSPAFNLGGPYVYCDATDATVAVNAENFNTADATFEWMVNETASPETGSSIDATEFGTYTVTVTVNGCSTTHSVEVTQSTIVVMAEVTDECIDNVYTLEVSDIEGSFEPATASYAWTGPNGFSAATQSAIPIDLGTYTVIVTTADGCVGTASLEVMATQCLIQRGISPNGDGENDSFDLTTMDVDQLSIFNRYGQEVYSRSSYTNQWVGQTDSGDELPTGTYFYMIERANGEQITGWIYINREE